MIGQDIIDDRQAAMDAYDVLPAEVRAAIAESPFPWGQFGVVGAMLQRGCAAADVAAMIRRADKATLGIQAGHADSRESPSSATDGSPCPGAGATAGGAAYRRDRR